MKVFLNTVVATALSLATVAASAQSEVRDSSGDLHCEGVYINVRNTRFNVQFSATEGAGAIKKTWRMPGIGNMVMQVESFESLTILATASVPAHVYYNGNGRTVLSYTDTRPESSTFYAHLSFQDEVLPDAQGRILAIARFMTIPVLCRR